MLLKDNGNRGQMLILVVIGTLVALTVGLSIASRTVTNIKVSKQNEESQRAFQAAEAGLEQALRNQTTTSVTTPIALGNNSNFAYTISNVAVNPSDNRLVLNSGELVTQGKGVDVWLTDYPNLGGAKFNGTLWIYWTNPGQNSCNAGSGNNTIPAIEILVLEGNDISNPSFRKIFYDSERCIARANLNRAGVGVQINNYTINDPDGDPVRFRDRTQNIAITDGIIMKIIPVYNSTKIAVWRALGPSSLPIQGRTIESVGNSGDTVRRIRYFEAFPQIPAEIFQYSLISQ